MRDESENDGGIRDDMTCGGGMWDNNISAGTGFAHFDGRDAG